LARIAPCGVPLLAASSAGHWVVLRAVSPKRRLVVGRLRRVVNDQAGFFVAQNLD